MWMCPICGEIEPLEFQRGHLDRCSLKHSKDTIGNPDHAEAHDNYGYKAIVVKPHEYIGPRYFPDTREDWDL